MRNFGKCVSNGRAYSVDALLENEKLTDAHIAFAVIQRMNSNHLWYVSEEFVPVCLCSDLIDADEKREIADRILRAPKGQITHGAVKMPALVEATRLSDRVGPNSLHFFVALGIGTQFLAEPVETWEQIPAFLKFKTFIQSMPITNDIFERLVRRRVIYANVGPKGESGFQAQLQLVDDALTRLPNHSRFTKKKLIAGHSQK